MLAGTAPLRGGPIVMEPKLDGSRLIATVHLGQLALHTRSGADATSRYPELSALPPGLGERSVVLDGEVVACTPDGQSSFQLLQARMHVARPSPALVARVPVVFAAFDCLWLDGRDLTGRPLRERRAVLEELALGGRWQLVPRLDLPAGPELQAICVAANLEGVFPILRGVSQAQCLGAIRERRETAGR